LSFHALIIPTKKEAELILSKITSQKTALFQGKAFIQCLINGTAWIINICGPGKSNAAHATGLLLHIYKPNLVCMIGVAGAYPSSGLSVGDIAAASSEIYADEGLMLKDGIKTMDELNLPTGQVDSAVYFNRYPLHLPEHINSKIRSGDFATVSACTGTADAAKRMEKKFGVICENMEGAAAAHVCMLGNTRMLELRGISNIVEDRDAAPLKKDDILKGAMAVQKFFLDVLV
jgi:futalosine hydrolase